MSAHKIKAGGISNLSDARYFAPFAEWVSFVLSPQHPLSISPAVANTLIGWIAGPTPVGEFFDMPTAEINQLASALQLSHIEITQLPNFGQLHPIIDTIIFKVIVQQDTNFDSLAHFMEKYKQQIKYFLLDFTTNQIYFSKLQQPNSPVTITRLQELSAAYPLILDMHPTENNVADISNAFPNCALQLNGGQETKPGIRSFQDLEPIVEQLAW